MTKGYTVLSQCTGAGPSSSTFTLNRSLTDLYWIQESTETSSANHAATQPIWSGGTSDKLPKTHCSTTQDFISRVKKCWLEPKQNNVSPPEKKTQGKPPHPPKTHHHKGKSMKMRHKEASLCLMQACQDSSDTPSVTLPYPTEMSFNPASLLEFENMLVLTWLRVEDDSRRDLDMWYSEVNLCRIFKVFTAKPVK